MSSVFKISKGLSSDLPVTYEEGHCYFTVDDGKFYIDTTNEASGRLCLNASNADTLNIQNDTAGKLYVLGAQTTGVAQIHRESSVYMENNVLMGAAWNDYAEYRKSNVIEPGRVVSETSSGTLELTDKRLQPGCEIISDTFGFSIGKTEFCNTPVAIAGRVLAYPYEPIENFELGCAVCSGPNGTVSCMTREEIMQYPERIIGTVSEIPNYETWGQNKIKVNNRIWIRVR